MDATPNHLDVTTSTSDGEVVLRLDGELDPATAPQFDAAFQEAVSAVPTPPRLVIDLAHLAFIDSTGLRSIIAAHTTMADQGGTLVVRSPTESTQRLFRITGLSDVLDIVPG